MEIDGRQAWVLEWIEEINKKRKGDEKVSTPDEFGQCGAAGFYEGNRRGGDGGGNCRWGIACMRRHRFTCSRRGSCATKRIEWAVD
ncbi:hypothetical protein E2562_031912 [Oryza meyeriana var. granulata]|uniref:Uncharacterized protein n=1 Tax=Oryza meyeriana var. granulata TaxID=110450 RepID=A0A6G1BPC6_9ORYZ|nr:hypothetical protein E2562_031912 [Oryza meyeriana var. granulata]